MRSIHILIAACAVLESAAQADDHGRRMPTQVPKAYVQECASCHMAYPPGLLPAASWQRLMGGLNQHYGSDASLDAATVQQLSTWLQTHAGTYKRAAIQSAAHCMACHAGAERGDFDDDKVRIPK